MMQIRSKCGRNSSHVVTLSEGRMFSQLLICSGEEPLNQVAHRQRATGPFIESSVTINWIFLHVNNMKTGHFTTGIFSSQ